MSSITLKEPRAKVISFGSTGRSVLLRPRLQTVVSSAEAKEFKKDFSFLAADVDESISEPVQVVVKSVEEKAKKEDKSEEETRVSSSINLGEEKRKKIPKKRAKRKFGKRER